MRITEQIKETEAEYSYNTELSVDHAWSLSQFYQLRTNGEKVLWLESTIFTSQFLHYMYT